jgi:hypothetical protein
MARYHQRRWTECYEFATRAIAAGDAGTHATDPDAKGRAYDLASVSAWELGKRPQALTLARQAAILLPGDVRIRQNVAAMERHTDGLVPA